MIHFDFTEWDRGARELGAAIDQVPFALSVALNDATFKGRTHLTDTVWPRYMEVRNRNFIRAALRVEKSTKRNLVAAVTTAGAPAGQRGEISKHVQGGTKSARKGILAIPSARIKGRRGAKGMPANLKPGALANSFRIGDEIYQRVKKGRGKTELRLMYTLKPAVPLKPRVPLDREFEAFMRRELRVSLPAAVARAMSSRK